MHDTACCFGYPSDSSRTARKRAGTLGWAGLCSSRATSSTRADSTSATAPGPSCGGRGAACYGPGGPGRHLRLLAWPPVRPGAVLTVLSLSVQRGCGPVEPGLTLARLLGWSAACTRSPAARGCAGRGSPGRAQSGSKGLRARGAGPITGTSAGLECCVHQIASSVRLRRLGLHRVGRSLDTVPPSRLGPVGRSSWAAIRPGRVQWALVPGPPDAHGGRVLVSRPVALHLAAGGDSTGASPAQPEPDSDAAGQGTGRRWIGGPAPGWTGDSESAARRAVSSQGEGARR
jgi:hypothetical protein